MYNFHGFLIILNGSFERNISCYNFLFTCNGIESNCFIILKLSVTFPGHGIVLKNEMPIHFEVHRFVRRN